MSFIGKTLVLAMIVGSLSSCSLGRMLGSDRPASILESGAPLHGGTTVDSPGDPPKLAAFQIHMRSLPEDFVKALSFQSMQYCMVGTTVHGASGTANKELEITSEYSGKVTEFTLSQGLAGIAAGSLAAGTYTSVSVKFEPCLSYGTVAGLFGEKGANWRATSEEAIHVTFDGAFEVVVPPVAGSGQQLAGPMLRHLNLDAEPIVVALNETIHFGKSPGSPPPVNPNALSNDLTNDLINEHGKVTLDAEPLVVKDPTPPEPPVATEPPGK